MNEVELSLDWLNPIDATQVASSPGLISYAHHVGSALIEPTKQGVIKSKALSSMEQQTEMQLNQIKEQIELLKMQAEKVLERKRVSMFIYSAKMSFEPLVGHTYFLYESKENAYILSMIAPEDWQKIPFRSFVAKIRLLADHTWEIIEKK